MAKQPDKVNQPSGTALAERKSKSSSRESAKRPDAGSERKKMSTSPQRPNGPGRSASLFDVYKRGQGYWVRMGSGIGGAILVLAGANWLYQQLEVFYDANKAWTLWLRVGIPLAFVVGMGYLIFWLVGAHRRSSDFMIATEGEMKKVSWSTRREVWGSTKVVIFFMLLLGTLLFIVDLIFMAFFSWIGVLQGPSMLKLLFGDGQ